jgi:GntR family transcriptional regulator/MocR family aminotransferase
MRDMDLHLVIDRRKPLRAQLEHYLRDGVRSGRLRPGVRLPPSRLLATELGVSRGVVVEAYAQLTAEGFLAAQGSGGTRVAATAATERRPVQHAWPSRIRFDLRAGLPDPSLFPRRAWSTAANAALRELPDAAFLYGPPQGHRRLRRALTSYLGRVRAIAAEEDSTFITCGSTHALSLLWASMRKQGTRRVAHEDPAWERIPRTISQAGLEPVPVRVDTRGLSVADLKEAGADAVVVSPAHQYPSGAIMHPTRRVELVRWARETGGVIVEDDYDAEYRFSSKPIAPLRSIAPDCVAYLGTTSKVLAPELRLGWLIVPSALVSEVANEHAVAHAQPSIIVQAAFARMLETGDLDRHLRRTRARYRARRAAVLSSVADHVPQIRLSGGAAGLHVMAWLPPSVCEVELAEKARTVGVALDPLHRACSVSRALGPALVIGYGAINEAAIPTAISLLGRCIAEWAPKAGRVGSGIA